MLTLIVIIGVAAVMLVAFLVGTQDREALVDVDPDDLPAGLPAQVTADDVGAVRFAMAVRGYRMDQVDDVLERLQQELADRDERIVGLEQAVAQLVEPALELAEREELAREELVPAAAAPWDAAPWEAAPEEAAPEEAAPEPPTVADRAGRYASDLASSLSLGSPAAVVPLPEAAATETPGEDAVEPAEPEPLPGADASSGTSALLPGEPPAEQPAEVPVAEVAVAEELPPAVPAPEPTSATGPVLLLEPEATGDPLVPHTHEDAADGLDFPEVTPATGGELENPDADGDAEEDAEEDEERREP